MGDATSMSKGSSKCSEAIYGQSGLLPFIYLSVLRYLYNFCSYSIGIQAPTHMHEVWRLRQWLL